MDIRQFKFKPTDIFASVYLPLLSVGDYDEEESIRSSSLESNRPSSSIPLLIDIDCLVWPVPPQRMTNSVATNPNELSIDPPEL